MSIRKALPDVRARNGRNFMSRGCRLRPSTLVVERPQPLSSPPSSRNPSASPQRPVTTILSGSDVDPADSARCLLNPRPLTAADALRHGGEHRSTPACARLSVHGRRFARKAAPSGPRVSKERARACRRAAPGRTQAKRASMPRPQTTKRLGGEGRGWTASDKWRRGESASRRIARVSPAPAPSWSRLRGFPAMCREVRRSRARARSPRRQHRRPR
jgi:hypothetical protein